MAGHQDIARYLVAKQNISADIIWSLPCKTLKSTIYQMRYYLCPRTRFFHQNDHFLNETLPFALDWSQDSNPIHYQTVANPILCPFSIRVTSCVVTLADQGNKVARLAKVVHEMSVSRRCHVHHRVGTSGHCKKHCVPSFGKKAPPGVPWCTLCHGSFTTSWVSMVMNRQTDTRCQMIYLPFLLIDNKLEGKMKPKISIFKDYW